MPSCRCQYIVFDNLTKRKRLCKKSKKVNIYCTTHLQILYLTKIIKIQSVYRSFYIRKKLKIYYKLPRDIQRKIIWHLNKDLYLKHFNSSITNIVHKKIINFYSNVNYKSILLNEFNINLINSINSNEFFYDLNYIAKIIIKYFPIINLNRNDINNIILRIRSFIIRYNYYNNNNVFGLQSIDLKKLVLIFPKLV